MLEGKNCKQRLGPARSELRIGTSWLAGYNVDLRAKELLTWTAPAGGFASVGGLDVESPEQGDEM